MLSNIHDSFFKSLFSVRENLLDLLQGTLPPEVLSRLHLDTLDYDPTEYVDDELAPYFKDICCSVRYGDRQIKISLLLEHKSFPSKYIHLQLLRYMINIWENQQSSKQELTPVICIVFYHGEERWASRELIEKVPEEVQRFIPRFEYVWFDTKDFKDQAIVQIFKRPNVKIGVWFLKRGKNLINFIEQNPTLASEILRDIRNIQKEKIQRLMVYLHEVSGMEPEEIIQIMKTISPEAEDAFVAYRNRLIEQGKVLGIEQGIEQGIEKGIEQGLKKIALNMISKGYSDESIAEITNLSIKRIQEVRKECSD